MQILTTDNLRMKAPSIFTMDSAASTSDRYCHIPTFDIVQGLSKEGFVPVWACQSNARLQHKKLFTKHMLRFRHVDAKANSRGLFPELVLINSHDGLSSYRLMAGIFRMVCSNGLIAGDTHEELRIKHQGDIIGNVIEGTYSIMDSSKQLIEHADAMSEIVLDQREKEIFASAAHAIRFESEDLTGQAVKADQLLRVRRHEESGKSDLFTTFNVVQENIIKGGRGGWTRGVTGRPTHKTMREVKSIDQNTALNRALWTLTEKMAELKRA